MRQHAKASSKMFQGRLERHILISDEVISPLRSETTSACSPTYSSSPSMKIQNFAAMLRFISRSNASSSSARLQLSGSPDEYWHCCHRREKNLRYEALTPLQDVIEDRLK